MLRRLCLVVLAFPIECGDGDGGYDRAFIELGMCIQFGHLSPSFVT